MTVQSIDRALDIVDLVRRTEGGCSLAFLSQELDLNKTTVYRIAGTLVRRGFLLKEAHSGRYRIGLAFVDVASRYLSEVELTTEAAGYLHELSRAVGHTTFLAVRRGSELVYLDKVEQYESIRRYSIIGQRKPLHCTALGKALMLDMPVARVRALLGREPFSAHTLHTLTTLDTLSAQLAKATAAGWTRDDEEDEAGTLCLAAPVRDYRGEVIAAISVSRPVAAPEPNESVIVEALLNAAAGVSRRMGRAES